MSNNSLSESDLAGVAGGGVIPGVCPKCGSKTWFMSDSNVGRCMDCGYSERYE